MGKGRVGEGGFCREGRGSYDRFICTYDRLALAIANRVRQCDSVLLYRSTISRSGEGKKERAVLLLLSIEFARDLERASDFVIIIPRAGLFFVVVLTDNVSP